MSFLYSKSSSASSGFFILWLRPADIKVCRCYDLRTYVLSHEHGGAEWPELVSDQIHLLAANIITINKNSLVIVVSKLEEFGPVLLLLYSLIRFLFDSSHLKVA